MNEEAKVLENVIDQAAAAIAVQTAQLKPLAGGAPSGEALGLDNLLGVSVKITVELGRTRMTLAELVKLAPGSLVPLDREAHEPVDILVNGKIVARGEVVTIGDQYGVRITSVQAL
jgi:flagellar motor switch protein FliN